jgi:hypothetical protein
LLCSITILIGEGNPFCMAQSRSSGVDQMLEVRMATDE